MSLINVKTPKLKKYLVILSGILITIIGLFLIVEYNLDAWAQKKLKEKVQSSSNGLYSLEMSTLKLSLFTGAVSVDSLQLTAHDSVWVNLQKTNPTEAPATISDVKVQAVRIKGISFIKLLFSQNISLASVVLKDPEWTLQQMKKDTASKPLHQALQKQFGKLAVKEVRIKNGVVRVKDNHERKGSYLSATGIEVQAKGIKIDSASYYDKGRFFYCKAVNFSAKGTSYSLPSGNYKLITGPLKALTEKKEISVSNLKFLPLASAGEMSRKAGDAVTRFRLEVPSVTLNGFDFGSFSRTSNIYVASVLVQKPHVNAFKDSKNYPITSAGHLPHDYIQQLTFGLNVRKVQVKNLYVKYVELAEKAEKTGYVTGSNIDITLTNLTNNKKLISAKNPAVLKVSGYLMGKAHMQATARLPLLDKNGSHSFKGTIGKANPEILNPMLEPSMYVSVKSGILQKGSFQVQLNRASANGTMELQYDNFKVELLSKGKEKKQSLGKKIKSVVANKLVIESDSKNDGNAPAVGSIQVNRRVKRSFLTYWKDCLADGAMDILGAPNPKAKKG